MAKRRGLTLIEPIIVLLVVGVLFGVIMMMLLPARERARRMRCEGALRSLGYGLHLYSGDFDDIFPPSLGELYPEFISDGGMLICPTARKATRLEDDPRFSYKSYTPAMLNDGHSDYVYVSGLRASDPASYVIAFDDEGNHGGIGVNVLFIANNVEWTTDFKALHEQLAKQKRELAAQGRTMTVLCLAWSRYPELPPPPRPWYLTPGGVVTCVCGLLLVALVGFAIIRARRGRRDGPAAS